MLAIMEMDHIKDVDNVSIDIKVSLYPIKRFEVGGKNGRIYCTNTRKNR